MMTRAGKVVAAVALGAAAGAAMGGIKGAITAGEEATGLAPNGEARVDDMSGQDKQRSRRAAGAHAPPRVDDFRVDRLQCRSRAMREVEVPPIRPAGPERTTAKAGEHESRSSHAPTARSGRESHSCQQGNESPVAAEWIEHRFDSHRHEQKVALAIRPIQPREGVLSIT